MDQLNKRAPYLQNSIDQICTERMRYADRHQLIQALFEEYLEMYVSRDDRLITHFSENFSGYSGSSDKLITNKSEWIKITRQDFKQIPYRINIKMLNLELQDLAEDVVTAIAFFNIFLPEENILSNKTARLVIIFRNEKAVWKISHCGFSIPYEHIQNDEVYPISQLKKRNQELEEMIILTLEEYGLKISTLNFRKIIKK